jgi:hypothetical protein
MITERGIARILKAAYHAEMSAYRSLMAASSFSNPVGRGAIRSASLARRKMAKAFQLRLGLEMRCEAEAREKRAKELSKASGAFRETWDGGKRKRRAGPSRLERSA